MIFLSAVKAWLAAPVPRPPQPISPTRSVSLFAANEIWGKIEIGANTDPSAAVVDVFKN